MIFIYDTELKLFSLSQTETLAQVTKSVLTKLYACKKGLGAKEGYGREDCSLQVRNNALERFEQ